MFVGSRMVGCAVRVMFGSFAGITSRWTWKGVFVGSEMLGRVVRV